MVDFIVIFTCVLSTVLGMDIHVQNPTELERIIDPYGLLNFTNIDQNRRFTQQHENEPVGIIRSLSEFLMNYFDDNSFEQSRLLSANKPSFIAGIFHSVDLDSNQVGVFSLDIVTKLLQMLTSSIARDSSTERSKLKLVTNFIKSLLINKHLSEYGSILEDLEDPSLPKKLIEKLEDESGRTSCIQLLVCKASPFLWSLQDTIKRNKKSNPFYEGFTQSMYESLPAIEEVYKFTKDCEQRFPSCKGH